MSWDVVRAADPYVTDIEGEVVSQAGAEDTASVVGDFAAQHSAALDRIAKATGWVRVYRIGLDDRVAVCLDMPEFDLGEHSTMAFLDPTNSEMLVMLDQSGSRSKMAPCRAFEQRRAGRLAAHEAEGVAAIARLRAIRAMTEDEADALQCAVDLRQPAWSEEFAGVFGERP